MASIAARYQIVLRNPAGDRVAIFDSFESLSFGRKVNDYGSYTLVFVDDDDSRFDLFEVDGQIEIWRAVPALGLDWYMEFSGFHRRSVRDIDKNGLGYFRSFGVDCNHLLARRKIAYKSGLIKSTKNDYAEDVMKEFVKENCGSTANDSSRIRNGVMTGFSVAAESVSHASTPVWTGDRSFQDLLEVLKEIANFTVLKEGSPTPYVVDFAVVPTGTTTFEFRTYLGQLGTDRRIGSASPVVFSVDLGNLSEVSYDDNHLSEVNAAIVLGRGDGSTRQVIARENATGGALSIWNDIESVIQASNNEFTYQLNDAGDAELQERKASQSFDAVPLQIESTLYGLHYTLGDRVSVRHKGQTLNKKVMGVDIDIDDSGAEKITVSWEDTAR